MLAAFQKVQLDPVDETSTCALHIERPKAVDAIVASHRGNVKTAPRNASGTTVAGGGARKHFPPATHSDTIPWATGQPLPAGAAELIRYAMLGAAMPSVYIETSIVSYATARPSNVRHIVVRQEDARRWWAEYSSQYDLFASQAVLDEAAAGDAGAAKQRLQMLQGIPLIPITDAVRDVAAELLARSLLPAKASVDALHVAAAAIGEVDYLLTLNCRHIANARMLPQVYRTLEEFNVSRPLICTPEEFLGDDHG